MVTVRAPVNGDHGEPTARTLGPQLGGGDASYEAGTGPARVA
jgi:hypothetical protein